MIFCLYIHLKLASKLISPHKEHEEDLSAAMVILDFYNDLAGRAQLILGNREFVVTAVLDGVSWSGLGGWGRGNVAGIYMSNLLAAFLLCARWGCNGTLEGGFHVSQRGSPKSN